MTRTHRQSAGNADPAAGHATWGFRQRRRRRHEQYHGRGVVLDRGPHREHRLRGVRSPAARHADRGQLHVRGRSQRDLTINQAVVHIDADAASVGYGNAVRQVRAPLRAGDFANGDTAATAIFTGRGGVLIASHAANAGYLRGCDHLPARHADRGQLHVRGRSQRRPDHQPGGGAASTRTRRRSATGTRIRQTQRFVPGISPTATPPPRQYHGRGVVLDREPRRERHLRGCDHLPSPALADRGQLLVRGRSQRRPDHQPGGRAH